MDSLMCGGGGSVWENYFTKKEETWVPILILTTLISCQNFFAPFSHEGKKEIWKLSNFVRVKHL